jgi:hypothetical protein
VLTRGLIRPARSKLVPGCASLLVSVGLSACGAPASYFGIPLNTRTDDAELQSLAERARGGDKHAQLELGRRYEEGRGVRADRGRALKLYRKAAADRGGTQLIYIPSSRPGGRAMTVPVSSGPRSAGLPEAAARLLRLQELQDREGLAND